LNEIVWRRRTLRNVDFEVLVGWITSYEIETLRSLSRIEIVEFAYEGGDARLDCVFPYQEADLRKERGEECERHGHGASM
jgi:hypothetical protein